MTSALLEARALDCIRGERTLFRDVSFALGPSSLMYVAGTNGSGKTTLLRILTGLGVADEGDVLWRGEPIRAQRELVARELVYVGHAAALKDDLSAEENLLLACVLAGHAVTPLAARDALATFGLADCLHLPARLMSQGQRRRAVLARLILILTLAHDAPLWILDEPFNALDLAAVALLEGLLVKQVDNGGIVILTTHQDAPVTARATARLQLDAAKVHA